MSQAQIYQGYRHSAALSASKPCLDVLFRKKEKHILLLFRG